MWCDKCWHVLATFWPGKVTSLDGCFLLIYIYIYMYMYMYIYIWLWGHLPPQFFHFYRFFPQFYCQKRPKRDVANLPRLCLLPVNRNNPKLAWDCCPKPFFSKRWLGLQFQAFVLVHFGFNVKFVGLFGHKKALNCRNVKHVKLYLSKKG